MSIKTELQYRNNYKLLKIVKQCQKLGLTNNVKILKRIETFIVQNDEKFKEKESHIKSTTEQS